LGDVKAGREGRKTTRTLRPAYTGGREAVLRPHLALWFGNDHGKYSAGGSAKNPGEGADFQRSS